ncbi:hypothetical protein [Pseudomonas sichuanensis]|uniref:hypothetical protein n=1 Tax=Pseudomonas TaxID=286 RepID=UPI0036EA5D17
MIELINCRAHGPAPHHRQKRSLGYADKFWPAASTLCITFVNQPRASLKQAIFNAACQWLPFVNLRFELVDDDTFDAQIKIHTGGSVTANYSMFGTDARRSAGASMVLGVTPDMDSFERTVLHEFGHALGCPAVLSSLKNPPSAKARPVRYRPAICTALARPANRIVHLRSIEKVLTDDRCTSGQHALSPARKTAHKACSLQHPQETLPGRPLALLAARANAQDIVHRHP